MDKWFIKKRRHDRVDEICDNEEQQPLISGQLLSNSPPGPQPVAVGENNSACEVTEEQVDNAELQPLISGQVIPQHTDTLDHSASTASIPDKSDSDTVSTS